MVRYSSTAPCKFSVQLSLWFSLGFGVGFGVGFSFGLSFEFSLEFSEESSKSGDDEEILLHGPLDLQHISNTLATH